MEQKTEVKVYKVDYICDECKVGKMKWRGITLTSYPPQYPHTCEKCGATQNLLYNYPHTEHREA